ncbi:MAG: FG-GAP-like repeat-containing protein, partial [Pseudorhodoplanes sp.]|nr:FG-GAP-like repeat-containing protein [Pseudorhodoplanes sp.]
MKINVSSNALRPLLKLLVAVLVIAPIASYSQDKPPELSPKPLPASEVASRMLNATSLFQPKGLSAGAGSDDSTAQTPVPDLFTGTARTDIVIPVPIGRAGMQPSIAVRYGSSSTVNSYFGVGWELTLGTIERRPVFGVNAESEFLYRGPLGSFDLVEISSGLYRPKIESGYTQFRRLTDVSGTYWVVVDKSGNRSVFGGSAEQRLAVGGNEVAIWALSEVSDPSTNYTTYQYSCDGGVVNDQGCTGNTLVPATISYVGHRKSGSLPTHCVLFRAGKRADSVPVVRNGTFLGNLSVRIDSIETYPAVGARCDSTALAQVSPESKFEFGYDIAPVSGRLRLVSLGVRGTQGGLAPLRRTFAYSSGNFAASEPKPVLKLARLDAYERKNEFGDVHSLQRSFADLNGDGLPDFCMYGTKDTFACLANDRGELSLFGRLGTALASSINRDPVGAGITVIGVFYPELNGDGRADVCALQFLGDQTKRLDCWLTRENGFSDRISTPVHWPKTIHYSQESVNHEINTLLSSLRFIDLNGDGLTDICWRKHDGLSCHKSVLQQNKGDSSLISFEDWSSIPAEFRSGVFAVPALLPNPSFAPPDPMVDRDPDRHFKTLRFVDLNRDGFMDICGRTTSEVRCFLHDGKEWSKIVTGPNWANPIVTILPPKPTPPDQPDPPQQPTEQVTHVGGANWKLEANYASIQFADIDGDGLPDICARDDTGLICYRGRGTSFADQEVRGPAWTGATWASDERYFRSVALVDINGDGIADACANNPATGLECFLGSVAGFAHKTAISVGLPVNEPEIGDANKTLAYVDVNGDGKTDLCFFLKQGLHCIESDSADRPDLLREVALSTGQRWTLEYTPSTAFANSRLPFAIAVLTRVTETSSMFAAALDEMQPPVREVKVSTQYLYADGYFNPKSREFLGFGYARIMEPSRKTSDDRLVLREYWFYQHDQKLKLAATGEGGLGYLKGRTRHEQVRDSSGRRYSQRTFQFATADKAPVIPALIEVSSFDCSDDKNCVNPIRIRSDYDNYGNKVVERHFGDPATPDDDVRMEIEYVSNESTGMVGLPRKVSTYAGIYGATLLASTLFFYDETVPCGQKSAMQTPQQASTISRGFVTREVRMGGRGQALIFGRTYDQFGNLVCTTDPKLRTRTIAFDKDTSSLPVEKRNPAGHVSRVSYAGVAGVAKDAALYGQIRAETDPNGARVGFDYDEFGRVVQSTRPDQGWVKRSYGDEPGPLGRTVRSETSEGQDSIQFLDSAGRVWREESSAPEKKRLARLRQFDDLGQVLRLSGQFFVGEQPRRWASMVYDVMGRQMQAVDIDGSIIVDCHFDRHSIHIGKNGTRELRRRDAFARLIAVEQVDDPVDVSQPNLCSADFPAATLKTSIEYDRLGRVRKITDASKRVTEHLYDDFGRIVRTVDPDLGVAETAYDEAGNVVYRKNAAGQKTFYAHDNNDRVVQKDYGERKPLGKGDVVFRYDEGGGAQNGRLTTVRTPRSAINYGYDLVGNRVSADYQIEKQRFDFRYEYVNGQLKSIRYPDGWTVGYHYDMNAVVSAYDVASKQTLAKLSSFNAQGNPQKMSLAAGSLDLSYLYGDDAIEGCAHANGAICRVERLLPESASESDRWGIDYSYNVVGSVERETHHGPAGSSTQYGYDFLGRLVEKKSAAVSATYEYDDVGNILRNGESQYPNLFYSSTSGAAAQKGTRSIHAIGREFFFDASGRLAKVEGREAFATPDRDFQFDAEGRLSGYRETGFDRRYIYDGLGRRVAALESGDKIFTAENLYECWFGPFGGPCYRHIHLGTLRIATTEIRASDPEKTWFYLVDRLGSVSAITDSTGKIVQRKSYSAFGMPSSVDSGDAVPQAVSQFGLHGKPFDRRASLYYFGARYYSPELGRFISADNVANGLPGDG